MASASTPLVNEPTRPHFSPHSKDINAQISGLLVTIGISEVVITPVYFEKTCLKKLIMIL